MSLKNGIHKTITFHLQNILSVPLLYSIFSNHELSSNNAICGDRSIRVFNN